MRFIHVGILLFLSAETIWCQSMPNLVLPIGHQATLSECITSARFSPDNKLVVTTGIDKTTIIWHASSGKLIHHLKGHTDEVQSATFSEDGKLVITASKDGTAKIWDVKSGELKYTLRGRAELNWAQLSSNGNWALTSPESDSDSTTIWDLASEKAMESFSGQGRLSPNDKFVCTIEYDIASLWNTKTGELVITMDEQPSYIQNFEFSPNSQFVITTSNETTRLWKVPSGELVSSIPNKESNWKASFSPDSRLAMIRNQNEWKIFNLAVGDTVLTIKDNSDEGLGKFSPDGKLIFFDNGNVWDGLTGQLKFTLTGPLRAISPNGSQFLTSADFRGFTDYSVATIWDANTGDSILTLAGKAPKCNQVQITPDGKGLVESLEGIIWRNLYTGDIIKEYDMRPDFDEIYTKMLGVSSTQFNQAGNLIVGNIFAAIAVWDSETSKMVYSSGTVGRYDWMYSPDRATMAQYGSENSAYIFDLTQPAYNVLFELSHEVGAAINHLQFSRDGKKIATASNDMTVIIWNASTGEKQKIIRPKADVDRIHFSPDGTEILTFSRGVGLKVWSVATGKLINTIKEDSISFFGSPKDCPGQFSPDGKKIAVMGLDEINIFAYPSKNKLIKIRAEGSDIDRVFFSPDSKRLVAIYPNNISKIWDASTGVLQFSFDGVIESVDWNKGTILINDNSLLSLFDFNEGKLKISWVNVGNWDWVVTHPSGLFDASPGAMDKLYFVQGLDIIDFNQLKERYYEPGLWKKVMAGEPLRSVVGMKSIDLPPDILVGQVDGEGYLNINLTNRGGGIGEVNLFVNGKEVIKDARDSNIKPDAPNASIKVFVGKHKSIVKGQENLIAVKAWNKDHWVQSRGQIVSYHSKEIESYKPAVHILTCGVSDYTGNEIDLKYAAKDANDVSVALQLGAKKLFGAERSYVYNLTTTQAKEFYPTKTNILKAFDKISSTAHPLDIFVMYVSGHGINHGGQDGDWHYLTQEAYTGSASAYNDPAIRAQTTISSNELIELFKKVPALKQVLMLDACASGKVVDNLMAQKDIESSTLRALDRMRDRTGMHIITGCTADAVSYEASKYGQGVLTYSLLEGIRGAALREDQYVDVNKLFQYAHDRVPQLAEGIGGIQSPQIFSPQGSQSFDIGLLSDVEKKEIPIAKIRPVYIRSNFQDENEMEDVLGLSKVVDESLNEVSVKGADASLIFVDVREYPDACKLIGRYRKEKARLPDGQDQIILKLRKKCGAEDKTFDLKGNDVNGLKLEILKVL